MQEVQLILSKAITIVSLKVNALEAALKDTNPEFFNLYNEKFEEFKKQESQHLEDIDRLIQQLKNDKAGNN